MPNLVLQLLMLFLSSFGSLCQACNPIDQDSLLSLHLNLSSPPWNWSSSTNCCLWEGIKCEASGRVSHLWLPFKGFSGTISSSIGNLTHLSHLNLSHNHLHGPLPISSFHSLTLLETIDLSYNSLSGELTGLIPSLAWNHSVCSIRLLDFSHNDFSGQVPPGLGDCYRLKSFRAGYNYLSGSLPDDIYTAASLEELSLPHNKLSGSISNDIVNLTSLMVLELYSNQLIGSIPKDIGKLANLKYLLLYRNNLSGSLPSSVMNCTSLKTLNLMDNLFAGNLSAYNFSMLSQLKTIDLYMNMFTGSFPLTLTSCRLLTALRLACNQLEGQIPPEIIKLKSLSFLSLAENKLTNISAAIRILMGCKNLNVLFLTVNFMNEAIPNYDQNKISDGFQNLRALSLAGCQLTGQVPLWLAKLTKLEVLLLSGNQITGSIPGWLGNLPSLFYIDLSQNNISGEFPKELSRLQAFVIEQNQFNRNDPDLPFFLFPNQNSTSHQYNRIFGLRPTIFLANNGLTGRIPAEIGQLKFVHVLDLSNNNFSGNIPNQISQLTNLERLDLSKNHLSGEIPASLSSLHFLSFFSIAENNLQGPIPSGGQFHTFPPSSFEGNPGLCGDIANRSCTTEPRTTTNLGLLSKSSNNMELRNGLIAGAVFGFIIGSVTGIVYPLPKLKLLQLMLDEG